MKIYMAINNKKNGRIEPSFGISDDPGEVARSLCEMNELKNYNIAEFNINKPLKILKSNLFKNYWSDDDEN